MKNNIWHVFTYSLNMNMTYFIEKNTSIGKGNCHDPHRSAPVEMRLWFSLGLVLALVFWFRGGSRGLLLSSVQVFRFSLALCRP